MNVLILLYLIVVHFVLLNISQNVELVEEENEIDEEETIYTGTVIKYLNITQIEKMEKEKEKDHGEDITISATTKKFKEKFYDQLNSSGEKDIYNALYNYCNRLDPELSFTLDIPKYIDKNKVNMERIMTSLIYDNPKFWWIESYNIGLKNTFEKHDEEYDILTILTVNFLTSNTIFQNYTNELVFQMNKELALETDILLYQIELMNLHTKYDVLKFIHDYIIRNTMYEDNGHAYVHTMYGPLVKHKSICSGYSEVLKHIASYFGINVIIARSLTHEWNYALLNGKWYIIDVTWDDPAVFRQEYDEALDRHQDVFLRPEKGDYSNLSYDYFLVGTDAFKDDEEAETDHDLIFSYFSLKSLVVYPEIEKENFVHLKENDEYVERIKEAVVEDESHFNETDILEENTNYSSRNLLLNEWISSFLILLHLSMMYLIF